MTVAVVGMPERRRGESLNGIRLDCKCQGEWRPGEISSSGGRAELMNASADAASWWAAPTPTLTLSECSSLGHPVASTMADDVTLQEEMCDNSLSALSWPWLLCNLIRNGANYPGEAKQLSGCTSCRDRIINDSNPSRFIYFKQPG